MYKLNFKTCRASIYIQERFILNRGPQIGNQWILTAAHCLDKKYDDIHAIVKVHDRRAVYPQNLTVEKVYNHENFHRDYNYIKEDSRNDFALLKLRDVSC